MIANGDGLVWLEALAEHYDEMAREIRAVARAIHHEQNASRAGERASDDAISISEAIRRVLSESHGQVIERAEIHRRVKAWPLKTRSRDLPNAIDSTLGGMQRSKQIVREGRGWRINA